MTGWTHLGTAIPLILAVSYVYAGTRHEDMWPILRHGTKLSALLLGLLAAFSALLAWLST